MTEYLYKLCVRYMEWYNKRYWKSVHTKEEVEKLEYITFTNGKDCYLSYGLDALWKRIVPCYYLIENAVKRLNQYEKKEQ